MQIPTDFLRESRRLFGRLRPSRGGLAIFANILASFDFHAITLCVTDGGHWLESYRASTPEPGDPCSFLIPPHAMAAACRADKGTSAYFSSVGSYSRPELRVSARCGGIMTSSVHPAERTEGFPARPVVAGTPTLTPARTMESLSMVAAFAARHGVCFTPAAGGRLIASCGGCLACLPAAVPPREFMLSATAVRVLGHPDFSGYENEVTLPDGPGGRHVMFRSWDNLLVAGLPAGPCPDPKRLMPQGLGEQAVLDGPRREAVVKWLRRLPNPGTPVRLGWEKPGHLTLVWRAASGESAVIGVRVAVHGNPPAMVLPPRHLADALEIGSTLCLRDHSTPVVCRDPGGGFCVVAPASLPDAVDAVDAAACHGGSPKAA